MNSEAIIGIGTVLIALIGAVITYIIKPYFYEKTTEKQRDDIVFWVKFAVNAAEQMAKAGIIAIPKKEYVVGFLSNMGFDIEDEAIDILIEAFVGEINKNKN